MSNKSKSSANKPQSGARSARKPGELSRFQKIVIVLFVVVFALSTLAGALASVFQSTQSGETAELNVESIDAQYEGEAADLEAKVSENPEDSESLRTLGDTYMTWGTYVTVLATTDEETSHANELFDKAIATYDSLLALGENSDVSVNRAMCEYYQGDTSTAISDLEALTESDPDYASSWLNLGVIYQAQGENEDAIAAYEKAVELDPDDEQGVKSSAESRLESLQGTSEEDSDGTSDEGASDDGTSGEGASDETSSDGSEN